MTPQNQAPSSVQHTCCRSCLPHLSVLMGSEPGPDLRFHFTGGSSDPIVQGGRNLGSHGQRSSSPSREISPNFKAHGTNHWAESPKMCPSPRIPEPGGERFQKAGGVRKSHDLSGPERGACCKELRETQRSHRYGNATESSDVGLSPGVPIPKAGRAPNEEKRRWRCLDGVTLVIRAFKCSFPP